MGAILLGIIGLVVGFAIGYLRFAAPLARKITAIERAKSRIESANEGIKLENQQLQAQLLQIDSTYQERIQALEQSYQSRIQSLQTQTSAATESISSADSAARLSSDAIIQELTAKHQAEILTYQQQIQELQTALPPAIAPSSDSPNPASVPSPSSPPSGGVSSVVTGLAGAAAGVATGIGLTELFSPHPESPPLAEKIADPSVTLTPEIETPFAELETIPQELPESLSEDSDRETIWNPLEESQLLPDSPTLTETAELESKSSATSEPWEVEQSVAQWLENEPASALPVTEDNASPESWLEIPALDEDLPSFFTETTPDPFANLFAEETEAPDLAFLELLQTEEAPSTLGDDDRASDPFALLLESDRPSSPWDFEELFPTDEENPSSSFDLSSPEQHDAGLDELFDSLSLFEEK